ncbi:UNVERIFIED_CONTAM: hypothetical protein FKN15_049691 [Acipenser sinensis]
MGREPWDFGVSCRGSVVTECIHRQDPGHLLYSALCKDKHKKLYRRASLYTASCCNANRVDPYRTDPAPSQYQVENHGAIPGPVPEYSVRVLTCSVDV